MVTTVRHMKRVTLILAVLAGCAGGESQDPAVRDCELTAARFCDTAGYSGNSYCLLVGRQECSPEDEASAVAFCNAHPDVPHDSGCHPQWR